MNRTIRTSIRGLYRKMHIPDDPLFYEKFYFAPGDLGFRAIPTCNGPVGSADLLGPVVSGGGAPDRAGGGGDALLSHRHRLAPARKAEFGTAQYSAWKAIQRAHAIANGVFVCAVNRVGHEYGDVLFDGMEIEGPGDHSSTSGIEFWGGSFIADPFGRILAQASHNQEEIVTATLDRALVETTRQHWPFLRDRRIDAYGKITRRLLD